MVSNCTKIISPFRRWTKTSAEIIKNPIWVLLDIIGVEAPYKRYPAKIEIAQKFNRHPLKIPVYWFNVILDKDSDKHAHWILSKGSVEYVWYMKMGENLLIMKLAFHFKGFLIKTMDQASPWVTCQNRGNSPCFNNPSHLKEALIF